MAECKGDFGLGDLQWTLSSLERRGLVYRSSPQGAYFAHKWNDVPFEEQINHVLMVMTQADGEGKWDQNTDDLIREFDGELTERDIEAIMTYLVNEGMVMDLSTKDGASIGCTKETVLAFKEMNNLNHSDDVAKYASEFKRKVLHYVDREDTFVNITSVLLEFPMIHQSQLKFLLDELQTDNLIILAKDNPGLNSKNYLLDQSSRVRARITTDGREYLKHQYERPSVTYNVNNSVVTAGVFAQGSSFDHSNVTGSAAPQNAKMESLWHKVFWYGVVPLLVMIVGSLIVSNCFGNSS